MVNNSTIDYADALDSCSGVAIPHYEEMQARLCEQQYGRSDDQEFYLLWCLKAVSGETSGKCEIWNHKLQD